MKTPDHQIAVVVKFLPATDTKSSRIRLSLPRWNGKRIAAEWNHESAANNTGMQAAEFLSSRGLDVLTLLDLGSHYALGLPFAQVSVVKSLFNIKEG